MTKTIRLYNFVSDQYCRHNLTDRRLKLSFSNQVNDLFELKPFDFGEGSSGRRRRYSWNKQIIAHSHDQGFISFSDTWVIPTMWAHYADNHRGVCLGFDVPRSLATQIEYLDELVSMDDRVFSDEHYNKKMIAIAQKSKSSHWAYEQEWRVWGSLDTDEKIERVENPTTLFFTGFGAQLELREVIFGYRSGLSSNTLKGILPENDDVIFKTVRPSFREFRMVEQQNPKFQK